MIVKIKPVKIKVKSKSYTGKILKVNAGKITSLKGINTHTGKRVINTIQQIDDVLVTFANPDGRVHNEELHLPNGFLDGLLLYKTGMGTVEFCYHYKTNSEGKNKPLESLMFKVAPYKTVNKASTSWIIRYTVIIKDMHCVGVYPDEVAKAWQKGIDLKSWIEQYDTTV